MLNGNAGKIVLAVVLLGVGGAAGVTAQVATNATKIDELESHEIQRQDDRSVLLRTEAGTKANKAAIEKLDTSLEKMRDQQADDTKAILEAIRKK